MKFIRWRKRKKIAPICMVSGDRLVLAEDDKIILEENITETKIYTEVGIFDAEVDGKPAIGGVFIE